MIKQLVYLIKNLEETIYDRTTIFLNTELPRAFFVSMISSLLPKSEDALLVIMMASIRGQQR